MLKFVAKWALRLFAMAVFAWLVLVVGGGVQARLRQPDLSPWHLYAPPSEVRAADMGDGFTLADYLAREARVFDEVAREIEAPLANVERPGPNRYAPRSISHPSRAGRNWNRTFELRPASVRGGALLLHGLTDSPYSVRAVASGLEAQGFYVLAMRMPGHGTVPAGLVTATWEDWLAAVRVGMRHARATVGPDHPLVIVGYSNGGALAVKYALDALEDRALPAPSRLVLLSPMMGVTPFAGLARQISRLGHVPGFEKALWLDVITEYNPFKYNSFPANAGMQTYRVTRQIQEDLARAATNGRIAALPPMLTFQSLVDATVSTRAVVQDLYDHLPDNGSELVLFDINRVAGLETFIRPAEAALLSTLVEWAPKPYRRTLVTNASPDTLDVAERSLEARSTEPRSRPIGMSWPPVLFSLSHVALPFPADDPLYGADAPVSRDAIIPLGRLAPRGEKAVLSVPIDTLMRASSNPFYGYMQERLVAFVGGEAAPAASATATATPTP